MYETNTNKIGSAILKERISADCRNTPSTTNPEDEEIVDAPGNDGNASMPEQVKRPNPWRKMMMISRSFLIRMRNVSENSCRENQKTRFVFGNVFLKILPFII